MTKLETIYDIKLPANLRDIDFELGIAEKPTAAVRIGKALDPKSKTLKINITKKINGHSEKLPSINLTVVDVNGSNLLIVPALGHLFTIIQKGKGWQYPVYDFQWVPDYESVKNSSKITDFHRRKEAVIELMRYLAVRSKHHVIMTDYDEEGEVIGAIVIKQLLGESALFRTRRMKFSSFAKKEIQQSFDEATSGPLSENGVNFGMYNRGLMRHYLDWLWGINLSRALMLSVKNTSGRFQTLSTGRVQGPTLTFVEEREKEINLFIPIPRFKISVKVKISEPVELSYIKDYLSVKQDASDLIAKVQKQQAIVDKIKETENTQKPPNPYNLSTLQSDAYRYHKITPSRTLQAAENLYLSALISYPRTSSEKYPQDIDHRHILTKLSKLSGYKAITGTILKKQRLKPKEGRKTDPAHPCIYPLGEIKQKLGSTEQKIFSLVLHRYCAGFGSNSITTTSTANFLINGEEFYLTGKRIAKLGWRSFAGKQGEREEQELPKLKVNQEFPVVYAEFETRYTKPPARFNQSSLLKKMEESEIGTKATRSEIIKSLFDRKFLNGESIAITPVGETIIMVLRRYSEEVLSIELSRKLERMGDLVEQTINNDASLKEPFTLADAIVQSITYLHYMIEKLMVNEGEVGNLITQNLLNQRREESIVGDCQVCKEGQLRIITSLSTGKRFVGCSLYFDDQRCTTTYPLPQKGRVEAMKNICKADEYPQVKVFGKRKPWTLCLNPECPLRENNDMKKQRGSK